MRGIPKAKLRCYEGLARIRDVCPIWQKKHGMELPSEEESDELYSIRQSNRVPVCLHQGRRVSDRKSTSLRSTGMATPDGVVRRAHWRQPWVTRYRAS